MTKDRGIGVLKKIALPRMAKSLSLEVAANLFDLQARLHQDNDVGIPRGENVVQT